VIILHGKHAGKKCVVLHTNDQGTNKHSFGHCVVAGIEKYPRKVTKRMSAKKIAARSKITPFIKLINYRHILPTRYAFDIGDETKQAVDTGAFSTSASKEDNPEARKKSVIAVKKALEAKYKTGRSPWMFKPLPF
jgi:large subunit ribosomal protein L27e